MTPVGHVGAIREVRSREFRAAIAHADARAFGGGAVDAFFLSLCFITSAEDSPAQDWERVRFWTMTAELGASAAYYAQLCAELEPQAVIPWVSG